MPRRVPPCRSHLVTAHVPFPHLTRAEVFSKTWTDQNKELGRRTTLHEYQCVCQPACEFDEILTPPRRSNVSCGNTEETHA